MGDCADQALEMVMEHENDRSRYRAGEIQQQEAYDLGIIDELGCEQGSASSKTCKGCGTSGLFWKQKDNGKWWLTTSDGSWHKCK